MHVETITIATLQSMATTNCTLLSNTREQWRYNAYVQRQRDQYSRKYTRAGMRIANDGRPHPTTTSADAMQARRRAGNVGHRKQHTADLFVV